MYGCRVVHCACTQAIGSNCQQDKMRVSNTSNEMDTPILIWLNRMEGGAIVYASFCPQC